MEDKRENGKRLEWKMTDGLALEEACAAPWRQEILHLAV